ncbi:MAG: ABC transporter ATP-binding protein [Oscillospiraceae bacterium]|nr:ABC transporter ATP-binding protein [Oscillospiraceae bacterium]
MLKITGLQKRYKGYSVLRDLNMNVEKGDVYGFIGTNGCGKTTTMNIICNIIPKDSGAIAFECPDVKIGFLPESPALYGYMNGYEYLDYIGACCAYAGDIKARTAQVLAMTGMTGSADRLIKGYSRGMNQRIGIAAALYSSPDLLILDEPTSALDPEGRAEVMDIIQNLAATGATIILCTHILADIERVANKVGILRNGVMAVEGTIQDIKRKFAVGNALHIKLRHAPADDDPLRTMEYVERSEIWHGGVTLYARPHVSEAEFFYKTISTLHTHRIVPESIEFKRLTLEQIYIGINNGALDGKRDFDAPGIPGAHSLPMQHGRDDL